MDYFRINKYSLIEENIIFISSNIIEILNGGAKSFGKVMDEYQKKYGEGMSLNMEMNIYLAMLFLYEIGQINFDGKKISLEVRKFDLEGNVHN